MKQKHKTWHSLKDTKCPTCGSPLEKGMLRDEFISCSNGCGFTIKDEVKEMLIKRDHSE